MSEWTARLEAGRKPHARELFAPLPRHYDRVAAVLSFGQDPRWRRAMVAAVDAHAGERVLDVATGTGLVAAALVRRYGCTVVGLDQSPEMLGAARARLARAGDLAARVSLLEGEAERLPFEAGSFDHLTFTYLLRYVEDPGATLAELARVVRPGGRIAMLEFGVPPNPLWRAAWGLYTHVGLPTLGRVASREWVSTGRFLAHSIPDFYARHPLEEIVAMWWAAGIESVNVRRMSLGGGVVMWGERSASDAGQGERSASGLGQGERSASGLGQGERSASGLGQGERSASGLGQGERSASGLGQGERSASGLGQGERSASGLGQGERSASGLGQGERSASGLGQEERSASGLGHGVLSASALEQGDRSASGLGRGEQSASDARRGGNR